MTRPMFVVVLVTAALSAWTCGKDSPSAPAPTPTPTTATLTGSVSVTGGAKVAGATVRIFDGPNAGRSVQTNASGDYSIDNLSVGNANVTAKATIYDEVVMGAYLSGPITLNFVFPIPACQRDNTASIAFKNTSPRSAHDIIWDGSKLFTLAPGQLSDPITATAGVAHSLTFRVAGTATLACSTSAPILTQCERGGFYFCDFPK